MAKKEIIQKATITTCAVYSQAILNVYFDRKIMLQSKNIGVP